MVIIDDTVKVAILACLPGVMIGVATLVGTLRNHTSAQELKDRLGTIQIMVNGRITQLIEESKTAAAASAQVNLLKEIVKKS
jgi:molybdopterin converting factor small subunit